jgi:hypothetical protein
MTGDATSFTPRAVPEECATLPKNHLDASVQDVTYLYDAYARDVRNGTSMVRTFTRAVNLHGLLHPITQSSEEFFRTNESETTWS